MNKGFLSTSIIIDFLKVFVILIIILLILVKLMNLF